MRKRRLLRLAAAGIGTTAAAATAGVVVERRVVRARRAAATEADRLGELHSDPVTVTADDGVVLHAEVDEVAPYGGSGDAGPTLLFVHGYALTLNCWHFQRQHFRGKRRMVFYDQRSHGRSERSDRANATLSQLGADLHTVLEELVPDGPVVLVGHSMGGMSIMALAAQHPELFGDRVVGAALIATAAAGLRPHRILSRRIPDRVGALVGPRLVAGLARAPELVDSARRRGSNIGFLVADWFAFGDDVPASYVEFLDEMLASTPFAVMAEFYPGLAELDMLEHLEAFESVPTTVIGGTEDRLTSMEHSRRMAERIEGARLVEARGAGHMVVLERAGQVNDALTELVEAAEKHASTRAT